jgi:hypothetical protein
MIRGCQEVEVRLRRLNDHRKLCFVVIALIIALEMLPAWNLTPDAVSYLSIARSVATGHGLRNLGYTHVAYPPGYPLLLTPAFRGGANPFFILRVIHWSLAIMLDLGLARWLRRQCPPGAALLILGLVMVNVTVMTYSRRALSELAFMAFAIWAVVPLNNAIATRAPRERYGQILIGAALVLVVTMIRESGLLFAGGFVAAVWMEVWEARLRAREGVAMTLIVGLPVAAAVIALLVYDESTFLSVPVFGTHLSGLLNSRVSFGIRAIEGLRLQIFAVGRLLAPGMFKAYDLGWVGPNSAIYLAICGLLVIGWCRSFKRNRDVYVVTMPLYVVLYTIWGFDADTRYLLPMLPVICLALWYLLEPYGTLRFSVLAVMIVAHFAVSVGYWTMVEIPAGRECSRQWEPMSRIASLTDTLAGPIAAFGNTPKCTRLVLSYLTDRPILNQDESNPGVTEPLWLIGPAISQAPAGFATEIIAGRYRLLRRVPMLPSSVR